MKTLFYVVLLVLAFTVVGCAQTNNLPVTFTFIASGDDGNTGQASFYDIRYSTDTLVLIAWDSALQVTGEPLPEIAGTSEDFTISVHFPESEKLYYFAIRVGDNDGNWSDNSNTVSLLAPDWYAPAAIMTFEVRF